MKIIISLLCMLSVIWACQSNKDKEDSPLTESSLLSFSLLYNGTYYYAEKINPTTWNVSLPHSATDRYLYGKYELEEGVFIQPNPNLQTDYTNPVEFTLSNANGDSFVIQVSVSNDLPYYGIWLSNGEEKYYPTTSEKGEQIIIIPGNTEEEKLQVEYLAPEGGSISPLPDLSNWPENTFKEYTITDAQGHQTTNKYKWIRNNYFTMVVFGDPEYDMRNFSNSDGSEIRTMVEQIIDLKNNKNLYFEPEEGLKIDYGPEIVLCLGDIDKDNSTDEGEKFMNVFGAFYTNHIPFVTIYGNHDWQPYNWWYGEGTNITLDPKDYGYSSSGSSNNDRTLKVVNKSIEESEKAGIENVYKFLSTDFGYNYREVQPFVFTFRGVRFYCGQTYWFQQWYKARSSLLNTSPATFYNTDAIVEELERRIDEGWGKDPAVWIQHYPMNDAEAYMWWHNRQGFGTEANDPNANQSVLWPSFEDKKAQMEKMINKTKNPVFFASHTHSAAQYTHNGFDEWITGYFQEKWIYVVLMKEGEGVIKIVKHRL